jgi:hypothetical protein
VPLRELFPATPDRERLLPAREGHSRIVDQCPARSDDKVSVVNAQTAAEEFNRAAWRLGERVPVASLNAKKFNRAGPKQPAKSTQSIDQSMTSPR